MIYEIFFFIFLLMIMVGVSGLIFLLLPQSIASKINLKKFKVIKAKKIKADDESALKADIIRLDG